MSDLRDDLDFHIVRLNDDTWEARDSQGNRYIRGGDSSEVQTWIDGYEAGVERALEEVDALRQRNVD